MRRHKIRCSACSGKNFATLVGVFKNFFVYWCSACTTQYNVKAN